MWSFSNSWLECRAWINLLFAQPRPEVPIKNVRVEMVLQNSLDGAARGPLLRDKSKPLRFLDYRSLTSPFASTNKLPVPYLFLAFVGTAFRGFRQNRPKPVPPR